MPSGLGARLLWVALALTLVGVHPAAVTGTNIGDAAATGVQLSGWAPDWFNFVSADCLGGTPNDYGECVYGDLAPGASVSMTITLKAIAGNKRERHKYEAGFATASSDTNPDNDVA